MKKFTILLIGMFAALGSIQAQIWQKSQIIFPETNNDSIHMGGAVCINGDYALVGAPGDASKGCAYIFYRTGGSWEKVAKLTASDGAADDRFGGAVSISDGAAIIGASGNVAVVGAIFNDQKGAAYLFEKPASGWTTTTETAILSASDGIDDNMFGLSVSISGDVVIVGAPSEVNSAYLFEKPASGWQTMTETAKLKVSDATDDEGFGISVNICGDIAIVGSAFNNTSGRDAAYIFEKPASGWTTMSETAKLTPSNDITEGCFGWSVSISENHALVSSQEFNNVGNGVAFLFEKPASGWENMTETEKLTASDEAVDDWFGYSVSISGNYAIIGAPGKDYIVNNSGSAYIFKNTNVGIEELNQNKLSIYPNPTTGFVSFKTAKNNVQKLIITDITGKEILSKIKPQQKEQINLSPLASGIYFIHLKTDTEILTRKFIKK